PSLLDDDDGSSKWENKDCHVAPLLCLVQMGGALPLLHTDVVVAYPLPAAWLLVQDEQDNDSSSSSSPWWFGMHGTLLPWNNPRALWQTWAGHVLWNSSTTLAECLGHLV